jgi:hypothetical protein
LTINIYFLIIILLKLKLINYMTTNSLQNEDSIVPENSSQTNEPQNPANEDRNGNVSDGQVTLAVDQESQRAEVDQAEPHTANANEENVRRKSEKGKAFTRALSSFASAPLFVGPGIYLLIYSPISYSALIGASSVFIGVCSFCAGAINTRKFKSIQELENKINSSTFSARGPEIPAITSSRDSVENITNIQQLAQPRREEIEPSLNGQEASSTPRPNTGVSTGQGAEAAVISAEGMRRSSSSQR